MFDNIFLIFFLLWLFFCLGYLANNDRHRTYKSYNPVSGRAADSRTAVPLLLTYPKIKYRSCKK